MIYKLYYGETGYNLVLPDDLDVTIIRKHPMKPLDDPRKHLVASLESPMQAEPLVQAVRGNKSVCILICDDTRPVPNGLILPEIVKQLELAGVDTSNVTILVATGLHEPLSQDTLRETVGDDRLFDRTRVVSHDATERSRHLSLGSTPNGTPIHLDRRFVEADVRIVVGLVEPHFMAGYSGGRKLIAPGVASTETISHLHAYSVLSQPAASNCILSGNPLHEEQLRIAKQVGPTYAVNVVLDENRKICYLNFGELVESHLQAVNYFKRYGEIQIDDPYTTVITTSAGHPLDNTYYQTIKGMVGAAGALAPEGKMFVVSRCAKGFGSIKFREAQKRLVNLGPSGFLKELERKPTADIDEWQTQLLAEVMLKGSYALYTEGLDKEERTLTGVLNVSELERSVLDWVQRSEDRRIAVIPEGPYVIPLNPNV